MAVSRCLQTCTDVITEKGGWYVQRSFCNSKVYTQQYKVWGIARIVFATQEYTKYKGVFQHKNVVAVAVVVVFEVDSNLASIFHIPLKAMI